MNALMSMQELVLNARTAGSPRAVVDRVSISISQGESLALVGESGSGKSITALALMGLLPEPSVTVGGGSIRFRGADMLVMPRRERRRIIGREIAMVFQEPMTSLSSATRPAHRIPRRETGCISPPSPMRRRCCRTRSTS